MSECSVMILFCMSVNFSFPLRWPMFCAPLEQYFHLNSLQAFVQRRNETLAPAYAHALQGFCTFCFHNLHRFLYKWLLICLLPHIFKHIFRVSRLSDWKEAENRRKRELEQARASPVVWGEKNGNVGVFERNIGDVRENVGEKWKKVRHFRRHLLDF